MKKIIRSGGGCALSVIIVSIAALLFELNAGAASISPAMEILSEKNVFEISAETDKPLFFTKKDFDRAIGDRTYSITVLSLPKNGTLYISDRNDTKRAAVGDIIPRKNLGGLVYQPSGAAGEDGFLFGTMVGGDGVITEVRIARTARNKL